MRGVFKKAEEFKFDPIPRHHLYDEMAAKKIKEKHDEYMRSKKDSRVEDPNNLHPGGESLVVHGNGTVDYLDMHHGDHFDRLSQLADSELKEQYLKDKLYNMTLTMPTYQLIHELFEGGLRIYMVGKSIYVDAYKIPGERQLDVIEKIGRANNIDHFTINLNYLRPDGRPWYKTFGGTMSQIRNSFDNLNKIPEAKMKDIELIRQFRSDEDPVKMEIPRRNRPTRNISPELAKQIADNMKPFRYKEVGAKIKELVKIAQNLDDSGRFQDADRVMESFEQFLS